MKTNHSGDPLHEPLWRIGGAAPAGAPPELRDALRGAFRRHHARRKRIERTRIGMLAASLALVVLLLWQRESTPRNIPAADRLAVAPAAAGARVSLALSVSDAVPDETPKARMATARPAITERAEIPQRAATADFFALPSFDPAIPVEQVRMVRLELPAGALDLVGVPLGGGFPERRILADVLLAQDGRPYAVRLVQDIR